jgi:hypothetical protein
MIEGCTLPSLLLPSLLRSGAAVCCAAGLGSLVGVRRRPDFIAPSGGGSINWRVVDQVGSGVLRLNATNFACSSDPKDEARTPGHGVRWLPGG